MIREAGRNREGSVEMPSGRRREMNSRLHAAPARAAAASLLFSSSPDRGGLWRRARAGFTIAELIVALAVGGVVLVLAHGILTGVADAADAAARATREATRDANRHLWLVRTFGSAAIGSEPQRGFRGLSRSSNGLEADRIAFTSRVRTAEGYAEREVRLGLDGRGWLIAELALPPGPRDLRPDTLVLGTDIVAFGADYLLEYGARARWVREWVSPVSAPVAARLRVHRMDQSVDTMLLHIGTRG